MSEGLRNFADQYQYAIHDPELIRRYRMIEDGKRDVATQISVAKFEEKRETAKRMKADGVDVAIIAKYTNLSVADIEALG